MSEQFVNHNEYGLGKVIKITEETINENGLGMILAYLRQTLSG